MSNTTTSEPITLDASGKSLGRLASLSAYYLQGKHKVTYASHKDEEVSVMVKNLSLVHIAVPKLTGKHYYTHTNYPGNLRIKTLKEKWSKNPQKLFVAMVGGMLPKNKLRKKRLSRLSFM
ncbi:MAG: uL13 family ribosomal protein [Patescibacteria group bacterium]